VLFDVAGITPYKIDFFIAIFYSPDRKKIGKKILE